MAPSSRCPGLSTACATKRSPTWWRWLPPTPPTPTASELSWPDSGQGRLARDAGAYVLLYGGQLVGFVDRGRKGLSLIDVDPSLYGAIGQGLSEIAARHRRTTITTVDGDPATASPIAPVLGEWGFATAVRGLTYRG